MERRLTLVPGHPVLQTCEYPTRYAAFYNHNTWVEHISPQRSSGFEWAVYYEPYQNTVHSNTVDAILIEILYRENDSFQLSCFATRPDEHQEELRAQEVYDTYDKGRCAAFHWLDKAHQFIRGCDKGRQ